MCFVWPWVPAVPVKYILMLWKCSMRCTGMWSTCWCVRCGWPVWSICVIFALLLIAIVLSVSYLYLFSCSTKGGWLQLSLWRVLLLVTTLLPARLHLALCSLGMYDLIVNAEHSFACEMWSVTGVFQRSQVFGGVMLYCLGSSYQGFKGLWCSC